MEEILTDLRWQVANAKQAGIRQYEIASQMGMREDVFSKVLSAAVPLPEDFPERLPLAIDAVRRERARRLLEGIDGEAVA